MSFLLDFCPSAAAEFPNDNPALHGGATWVCLEIGGPIRAVVRPAGQKARQQMPSIEDAAPSVASPAATGPAPSITPETPPMIGTTPTTGATELVREDRIEEDPFWPETVAAIVEEWLTSDEEPAPLHVEGGAEDPPAAAGPELVVTDAASNDIDAAVAQAERPALAESNIAATADIEELTVGDVDESQYEETSEDPSTALEAFVGALVGAAMAVGSTRAAAVVPALVGEGRVDATLLDEKMAECLLASGIAERSGSSVRITGEARCTLDAWRDVLQDRCNDLSACGTTTLDVWGAELLVALGVAPSATDLRRELRRRGVAAFGMLLAA